MLASYEASTLALLQAPSSPIPLVSTATLNSYINTSRTQVAVQGACVREYITLDLVAGQRQYSFSAVTGLPAGVDGIYHIRQLLFAAGTGLVWVPPRPFEFFTLYALNNQNPPSGEPTMWSQFGQGTSGSIFIDPLPDGPYTCSIDVLGTPTVLANDTDPEAIPPIWTLAVPFYAAWLGFMSMQRSMDADKMLERFQQQMALARNAANPNVIVESWSQSPDRMEANRLGGAAPRAGAA